MRKRILAMLLSVIMVLALMSMTAFAETIQNVAISENGILTWDPVDGATKYACVIGGNIGITGIKEPREDLKSDLDESKKPSGVYTISLYAYDASGNSITEVWTGEYRYTAPQLPTIKASISEDGVLTWDPVDGATKYTCVIGGSYAITGITEPCEDLKRELDGNNKPSGDYTIHLYAYDASGNSIAEMWTGEYRYTASYNVTVVTSENGTVTADKTEAAAGETITVTTSPADGYELEAISVKDSNDSTVTITSASVGNYTFTMPDMPVTVTATFKQDRSSTYTVKGIKATGSGYYSAPSLGFFPHFNDEKQIVWADEAADDCYTTVSSFFTEQNKISTLRVMPEDGTTYYFHLSIYNGKKNDHSVVPSIEGSYVDVRLEDFDVSFIEAESVTVNDGQEDCVDLWFSATKKTSTPPPADIGTITIRKTFSGIADDDRPINAATFTITGSNGTVYSSAQVGDRDFTRTPTADMYMWQLTNVPTGTYIITETNYDVEGYTCTVTYSVSYPNEPESEPVELDSAGSAFTLETNDNLVITFVDTYVEDEDGDKDDGDKDDGDKDDGDKDDGDKDNGDKDDGDKDNGDKDNGDKDDGDKDDGDKDDGDKDSGDKDNGDKDSGDKDSGKHHDEDKESVTSAAAPAPASGAVPTGDSSHILLWCVLMLMSGGTFAGCAVYGKKRKTSAK